MKRNHLTEAEESYSGRRETPGESRLNRGLSTRFAELDAQGIRSPDHVLRSKVKTPLLAGKHSFSAIDNDRESY